MNQVFAFILITLLAGVFILVLVCWLKKTTEKNEKEAEEHRRRILELVKRHTPRQNPQRQSASRATTVKRVDKVEKRRPSGNIRVVGQSQRRQVKRQTKSIREGKGWIQSGNSWTGFYRTQYGSYKGRIESRYSGHSQSFIIDPPPCLHKHIKSTCFHNIGENTYEIHFSYMPKNIDDAISNIERILIQAHEGRNCRA